MNILKRFARISLSTVFFTMLGTAAIADDTEIFFTDVDAVVKPNVMLILDASGSMTSNKIDGETRLAVMKEATKNLLDSVSDTNVGLMFFGGNDGAYFKSPVKPIDDAHRAFLKSKVDELSGGGNTPLSESLFEAMRYYQGEDVFIRDKDGEGYNSEYAVRWPQSDVDGVSSGETYDSPIEYECQPNNIVLLTDGEPTSDTNYQSDIEDEIGNDCSGNCLDEIADYMWSGDMLGDMDGDQKIITHTVGFQTNQTLLENTASAGNGSYVLANDSDSLEKAFGELFDKVLAQSTTFSAPGIAVNTFDRLNHLDSLYFAVFQPAAPPLWTGNLKRYKLGVKTDDATGEKIAVILDEDGDEAVEPSTGFFKDSARSWWSPTTDGKNVQEGGAASQHDSSHALREVYTYLGGDSDLTGASNEVSEANVANVTKALLGDATMSDDYQKELINWIRGADVDGADPTLSRKFIADPLHSVPHLIVYGGTALSPTTAIFFGDNQGFIHAIDGSSGDTHFSFMPQELLSNQAYLKEGTTSDKKRYGMDGKITSWVYDDDFDGKINDGDDHAYIYAGMRRGGKSYYALDVTDPESPALLWQIDGGVTGGDFEELGQTWSTPAKSKVKIHNTVYDVLVFGGGYDPNQDTVDFRNEAADSSGRALYIVDAATGDLLWWAGPAGSGADLELADMNYSIPSAPKILDITGDGWINQIYVGDMGGQIFRFDITNGEKVDTLATGGRIADFAEDDDATANRRFYHAPDLFGMKFGGQRYLGLIIGSGYQASPLDKVIENRIYMMRMPDVTSPPLNADDEVEYTAITENDLYDATDNLIQQGTETEKAAASTAISTSDGWYIRLENAGEKVLSTSQTINNEVFITTYEPTPSDNPCVPAAGTSRLYHISVVDGRAVKNYDLTVKSDPDELTQEDRLVELNTLGLPPDPQRMRVDDTDIVCVGAECMTVDSITGVVETYWYED